MHIRIYVNIGSIVMNSSSRHLLILLSLNTFTVEPPRKFVLT